VIKPSSTLNIRSRSLSGLVQELCGCVTITWEKLPKGERLCASPGACKFVMQRAMPQHVCDTRGLKTCDSKTHEAAGSLWSAGADSMAVLSLGSASKLQLVI